MRTSRSTSHLVSSLAALPLYLACQAVSTGVPAVAAPAATDFVAIVDVSGSMSWDLPEFKRHLKNRLASLLQPGDTFSLLYFSGPKQNAVLLDQAEVRAGGAGLADVAAVHATIDRLDTIGLTCFTEPLDLVVDFAARLRASRPKSRRAVLFGSDGYDNTSAGSSSAERRRNILAAMTRVAGAVDMVTIVGVGYGCDQALLQDMAASAGGQFIFATDIHRFNRDFDGVIGRRPTGARRRAVTLDAEPVDGVVFSVGEDGEITQFAAEGGTVSVPEDVTAIWYLANTRAGDAGTALCERVGVVPAVVLTAAYAAIVLFAQRARRKVVRGLVFGLGDVNFIQLAGTCFGPQRYNALADVALEAVRGRGRLALGFDPTITIRPDAFTVMDALHALRNGRGNRIVPDDPRFSYKPITRRRVASGGVLTAEDVERSVATVAGLATGAEVSAIDTAIAALSAIRDGKGSVAKYAYLPAPEGYPIDDLVFASEEANVSIRLRRAITVDLFPVIGELPAHLCDVPTSFETFRYQTFTVITGRVLNLAKITAILDEGTWAAYARAGLVVGPWSRKVVEIDLSSLPLVNDTMVDAIRAEDVVSIALKLELTKAQKKVWDGIKKAHDVRESSAIAKWIASAGVTDATDTTLLTTWLDKVGIGDGGFSPPSVSAPSTDKRRTWMLAISIPGLSSLPSVNAVRTKLAKITAWQKSPKGKVPKLTFAESLVAPTVAELDTFCAANGIDLAALEDPAAAPQGPTAAAERETARAKLVGYAKARISVLDPTRKELLFELSKAAITVIAGGEWFSDLKPGDTAVEILHDGTKLACKIEVEDVDLAI